MHVTASHHGKLWKIALALLVAGFLAALAATMVIAARRVTPVTDADYYKNGLRYGKTPDGLKNPGLHWTLSASLSGNDLLVRVRDRSGAPVANGKMRFEPKRAGLPAGAPLILAEAGPGLFRAPRPFSPEGELHGTLHFSRGDATATRKLVLFN